MSTRPCPRCERPNAAHRATCLYCGEGLPDPAAPPIRPERAVPEDLDALLTQALRTGDVGRLKRALAESPPAATPTALATPMEEPAESVDHWEALRTLLAGGPPDRLGLLQARTHLEALILATKEGPVGEPEQEPQQEPDQEPVPLPPYRLPWALAVDPPRDPSRGSEVAFALGLDLASARMLARLEHPKVALRSQDRGDLLRRADAWSTAMGLPAAVVDADQLLAMGPASLLLEVSRDEDWRVLPGRGWRADPDQLNLAGDPLQRPELRAVVTGEVAVRRFRTLGGQLLQQSERRLAVADLHGPGMLLRAVEGLTRFSGWPELEGLSAVQAFRGFLALVVETWPVACPGPKRCVPVREPSPGEDGRAVADGWAEWEEHTRISRVLLC